MIDIYHSRRGRFRKCLYWINNNKRPVEALTRDTLPTGIFYAKEVNAITSDNNIVNGDYMFDRNAVLLVTDDDIEDITVNSVVEYNGLKWFVSDIQSHLHQKETEFSKEKHATRFLQLRR